MRIVVVKSGFLAGSGTRRVIESWARTLGEAGHTVTVVSQASPSARPLPELPGVRSVLYESSGEAGRFTKLWKGARASVPTMQALFRDEGFDLILSHDPLSSVVVHRTFPRVPLVQTFHSPIVDENRLNNWKYASSLGRRVTYPITWAILRNVERQALRAVSAAHTLSDFTWNILSGRFPEVCRDVPWVKIPGTFDSDRFVAPDDRRRVREELGLDPDKLTLLSIRRLVPRNGVDRILRSARELRDRMGSVQMLIGGTGQLEGELKNAIKAGGLGGLVEMLGFVPEDRLVKYYQAADVFLLPTRDLECFGLPVIEAMGCGCPSLVMPEGGPAEVVRDHPEWIARENSDEAFTELLERYLSDKLPPIPRIETEARRKYAEGAVRSSILDLVQRFGGERHPSLSPA